MKKEIIESMTEDFEAKVQNLGDIEFWYARDLQKLLGYGDWRNFTHVISKAKESCQNSNQIILDHFVDVNRVIEVGKGAKMEISDTMLSRYACYLIAQNGDPRKNEIAFAQTYFALQTRKQEILVKRLKNSERVQARKKLTESERILSGIIYERGVMEKDFAIIRSEGDKALFGGYTTQKMKNKLNVPKNRPLADFLPTITIKAKDFANEITSFNVNKDEKIIGQFLITQEHVKNNEEVRKLLIQRGINPENLPKEEDIKKIERELQSDTKKSLKNVKSLRTSTASDE